MFTPSTPFNLTWLTICATVVEAVDYVVRSDYGHDDLHAVRVGGGDKAGQDA